MSFHWFDVGAAIFLLACVVYSSLRGFVKELFTVLAWIAGYFGSIGLHPYFAPLARKVIKTSLLADLVTFFLLFAILYIAVRLLGLFSQKKLGLAKIPAEINHGAGAIMGVAKGAFFLAIFLAPLSLFPKIQEELVKNSITADLVISATRQLSSQQSEELPGASENLKKRLQRLKGAVKEKTDKTAKDEKKKIAKELKAVKEKAISQEAKAVKKIKEEFGKLNGLQKVPPIKQVEPTVKVRNVGKLPESEENRKQMDDFIESFQ